MMKTETRTPRQIQAEVSLDSIIYLLEEMNKGGDVSKLAMCLLRNDLTLMKLQIRNIYLPYKEIEK